MVDFWLRAYTLTSRGDVLDSVRYGLRNIRDVRRHEVAAVFLHPDLKPAEWPQDLPPCFVDPTLSRTLVYFDERDAAESPAGAAVQARLP